jgi:hypothetical protein
VTLCVYGIRERGSKEVRYIGQTSGSVEDRLAAHFKVAESKPYGCNLPMREWLSARGEEAVETFKIAKVETRSEALATEKVIIALCLRLGHRLFNQRPRSLCAERLEEAA